MVRLRGLLGAIAGAALALAATQASAGDGYGSNKEPVAPAWTGLYVGAAIGYGFGHSAVEAPGFGESNLRGEHGAVTVGYDVQLGSKWIAGLFADYALGSTVLAGPLTMAIDNQWAIGGRLGVLATPSTLLYASGGYTGAQFEAANGGATQMNYKNVSGFFVGLGGEQALTRTLSLKLDYRFSDYGDVEALFPNPITIEGNDVHSLRFGMSWKFR